MSIQEIEDIAPDVPLKAEKMKGYKKPFISLQELETACGEDVSLQEALDDVIVCSLRYAESVCRFEQIVMSSESLVDGTREEIERVRSTIHDSTIDAINLLSRTFKSLGKSNLWINAVAAQGRASYGKFAILTAFEVVLQGKGGK